MNTLYDLIYDFLFEHIFTSGNAQNMTLYLDDFNFQILGQSLTLQDWLCHTASIISIIIILVMCCLFIYKIIKLIGGLIR